MKKNITKTLKLSKSTLRALSGGDLTGVAGGMMNNSAISRCWASGCTCPN